MSDREAFCEACLRAISEDSDGGIGTLSEKLVHKTVKLFIEPRRECHEVEYLGSVVDVLNESGVYEIQTGGFSPLVGKIKRIIDSTPVTLVKPVVAKKRILRLDEVSKEVVSFGREIKYKNIFDFSFELYKIRELVGKSGFTLRLVSIFCEEERLEFKGGKKRERRGCLIPKELCGIIDLRTPEDYLALLPLELGERFSADEFRKAAHSRSRYSYYFLRLLCDLGLLIRERGASRAYIYSRNL